MRRIFTKKWKIPSKRILFGIFIISLWLSTLFIVPLMAKRTVLKSDICVESVQPEEDVVPKNTVINCETYLSGLGITGDMFGAINALFSALALLAVAYTLREDTRARREDKKPLVIYNYNGNSLTMQEPKFVAPESVDIMIKGSVDNLGEPALNINVNSFIYLKNGDKIGIGDGIILLPMGQGYKQDVQILGSLNQAVLRKILSDISIDEDGLELHVEISFSSLQGTQWATKNIYAIKGSTGKEKDAIRSLISNDQSSFESLWGQSLKLTFDLHVNSDKWEFYKK